MATVQTRLQFNVRKKRLNSSKLNTGKENANYRNKRSSALGACVEDGTKFYENKHQSKCKDSLSKPILLLDDSSDSDLDIEYIAVKQHVNKAVGKRASQCTENVQVVNTDDEPTGLYIPLLRMHIILISFKRCLSVSKV
jgi:hypothetical protein